LFANTPNLNTVINFRYQLHLKIVQFLCTLDYVPSLEYLFQQCGVEKFTMPVNMPALTTMQYALLDSPIKEFIFPVGFSAPLLTGMFYLAGRAVNIESFSLPDIPSLLSANLLLYYTKAKTVTISGCENLTSISQLLEGNTDIEQVTLPSFQNLTAAERVFYGCINLKKLTLNGTWNKFGTSFLTNCYLLRELHYPRILTSYTGSITNQSTLLSLSIIHLPDYLDFSATASQANYYYLIGIGTVTNNLKKVYGDFEFASDELGLIYNATYYKDNLEEVNLPKLRVSRVDIGSNGTTYKMKKLTTLVVDWQNSTYSGTSPQIRLAAPLDSAWLNSMFTALPVVTGKTIDVRYCDGYATCDKTIATAKGWTVT
jgi:hypothetical protein